MKYLLFPLALLLVGCSDMDEKFDSSYIGNPIVYAIEGITTSRATLVTTDNLAAQFPTMAVYAVTSDGIVFADAFNSSTLQPSTQRYWTSDSYVFYSYPEGTLNPTVTSEDMTFEYTVGTDATTTPDIVVAREEVSRENKVVFDYQHIFTAVCVRYESLIDAHSITSVRIKNSCITGTCKVSNNKVTCGTCAEWSNLNTPSDLIDDEAKEVHYNGQLITKDGYIFMTIPGQTINIEVVIDGKTVTASCENPSSIGGRLVTFTIEDDYTITVNDGAVLNKTVTENTDGTYNITLEAYVTGMVKTEVVTKPTNTVLVLDCSGSMDDVLWKSPIATHTYKDNIGFDKLDTSRPQGYYVCAVNFESFLRDVRYSGQWQYYNKTLKSWIDIESSVWNITVYRRKLSLMQSVCEDYVNSLSATGNEHLVSVVAFGEPTYGATAYCTNVDVRTGKQTIIDAIYNTSATGATPADEGMSKAQSLMMDKTYYNAIVFITDGEPNHGSGFSSSVANATIQTSNTCKSLYDATVFSIGIFDEGTITDDCADFLDRVSSNYTGATTYANGTRVASKYYSIASSTDAISSIMDEISIEVKEGGASIQLGTDSYILDIISDVFYAPTDGNIVLKQADYNESTKSFDAERDVDSEVSYRIVGSSVYVTGFDYSKYFCGTGNNNGGRKLIIHINNLRMNPDNYIPGSKTNGYGSGLYSDDNVLISAFQSPNI